MLGVCAIAIVGLVWLVYFGFAHRLARVEQKLTRIESRSEKRHRQMVTATLTLLLALQPSSAEVIARTYQEILENGGDDEHD